MVRHADVIGFVFGLFAIVLRRGNHDIHDIGGGSRTTRYIGR